jgi:hypothetical protein
MKCHACKAYFAAYSHNPVGECDCPPCVGYCGCQDTKELLKAALYALDDVHACDEQQIPDETLARVAVSIGRLRRALGVENAPRLTHAEGCWSWGAQHYMCAYRHIKNMERYKDDGK